MKLSGALNTPNKQPFFSHHPNMINTTNNNLARGDEKDLFCSVGKFCHIFEEMTECTYFAPSANFDSETTSDFDLPKTTTSDFSSKDL